MAKSIMSTILAQHPIRCHHPQSEVGEMPVRARTAASPIRFGSTTRRQSG